MVSLDGWLLNERMLLLGEGCLPTRASFVLDAIFLAMFVI